MQKPFEQLKNLWYKKLEESGFKEIEDTSHPDQPLKEWHAHAFKLRKIDGLKAELSYDYYLKARELIDTYAFDNPTHKVIWRLHAEGLSKRKIEKEIEAMTPSYKRSQIESIIKFIATSIL